MDKWKRTRKLPLGNGFDNRKLSQELAPRKLEEYPKGAFIGDDGFPHPAPFI